ncbi:MAG: hypothetical protein AAF664_24110 [Planctomycetota bacterium]
MSQEELPSFSDKTKRPSKGRVGVHRGSGRRRRIAPMPLVRPAASTTSTVSEDSTSLAEAVTFLSEVAKTEAAKHGYVCIVEFAGGSESTYIHVRRTQQDQKSVWYGIRISAHLAKYACSSDYEQLLLSNKPSQTELNQAAEKITSLVLQGGRPVAEPHLIRSQIWEAQVNGAKGERATTVHEGKTVAWIWQGADNGWVAEAPDDLDIKTATPTWIPRVQLDTATTAAIRHRINRREAWAADETDCF